MVVHHALHKNGLSDNTGPRSDQDHETFVADTIPTASERALATNDTRNARRRPRNTAHVDARHAAKLWLRLRRCDRAHYKGRDAEIGPEPCQGRSPGQVGGETQVRVGRWVGPGLGPPGMSHLLKNVLMYWKTSGFFKKSFKKCFKRFFKIFQNIEIFQKKSFKTCFKRFFRKFGWFATCFKKSFEILANRNMF